MIIPWVKNSFGVRRSMRRVSKEEQELLDFFNTVLKEGSAVNFPLYIHKRIEVYEGLTLQDKIKETPELYLTIEEQIVAKAAALGSTKLKLRQEIKKHHSCIEKYDNISLIFKTLEEQDVMLCHVFLRQIIDKVKTIDTIEINNTLSSIESHLNTLTDLNIDLIEAQKLLLQHSNQLFQQLQATLGEHATDHLFVTTYKHHFQSYYLLNSFVATFRIIPEEILVKDLINFPSKKQMLKMLKKQLLSMEEINDKLTQEVVERKKIEEELKQNEHLQTSILETAMDGIILVNSTGTVLSWNKQAECILELPKEETLGRNIFSIIPQKFRAELQNSFKNYITTGQDEIINRRIETAVTRKDDTTIFIELTIIPIETKDGYLFNAFFRDITNRKMMDREIIESKIVAEKSAKAKSVFLSNMSHEIRTPLNVILGLTSILQKENDKLSEFVQKNLEVIQFSAKNLLVLINDVLDFSKIEAGKYTLEKNDFNIHDLLDNISSGFLIKAQEKGLKYTTIIDPTLPRFVIGDQFRLNQILTNLLGNAIKFTSKGEITVTVSTIKKTKKEISIQFSVSDTGVGIPKDKLQDIFNSFYQVQKPGKYKIEGTGLGLSISKQLIELHDSVLHAKSTVNQGSVFEFTVVYPKSKLQVLKKTPVENHETDKIDCLSGIKVLVVEDNKMNQFFIQQLFSSWGIQSDIADNGTIALEKLDTTIYDLVLMDMHMPIMDGLEATKHIRKSKKPHINSIPIIGCSADVFPEAKKNALDSGMNFYITKPIAENALQEIICTLKPKAMNTENMIKASIKASKTYQKATENTATTNFLNFDTLKKIFGNDTDIIKSILGIFLEETPKDYDQLQEAFNQKDLPLIAAMSHKLKSSYQTIGLEKQYHILTTMEHLAKENNHTDIQILQNYMNDLDSTYPAIMEEVQQSFSYPFA